MNGILNINNNNLIAIITNHNNKFKGDNYYYNLFIFNIASYHYTLVFIIYVFVREREKKKNLFLL